MSVGRPPKRFKIILEAIETKYLSGEQLQVYLPTEHNLAKEFSASRGTIRAVLDNLIEKKYIYRDQSRRLKVSSIFERRKNIGQFNILIGTYQSGFRFPFYDQYWSEVFRGIFNSFYGLRCDFTCSFQNTDFMEECRELCENHFASSNIIKGVAFLGQQPAQAYLGVRAVRKLSVSIDYNATKAGIHSVCFDNVAAGKLLAKRLIMLGHRRCLAIIESTDRKPVERDQAWTDRWHGFKGEYHQTLNITPYTIQVLNRNDIFQQTAQQITEVLKQPENLRPTAIILPDTAVPEKWVDLVGQAGLRIIRDISVVGYGNSQITNSLTAIRFNPLDLGYQAGVFLRNHIALPIFNKRPGVELVKGRYVAGETHCRVKSVGYSQ